MTARPTVRPAARPGRPELMAPAGGLEAGYAAFHYGADAVYLGLKQFSARADAENFTIDELDALTGFAHALEPRRRVYAAVNTLVLQDELPRLADLLGRLSDIGVDALIVQDLGVFRVARQHFPELRLIASTQMAVHNRAGVEALRQAGFHRVTLARELTLDEIRGIVRAVPDVETEVFVHGALCYSYSGLCLISSHLLGRSGNRGRCAYLCRDTFRAGDAPGALPFSMKDLALPGEVRRLCDAGVTSLKIEGRKKAPLYVAAATQFYRRLIDGTLSAAEQKAAEADLQSIFSRPWTRLYAGSTRHRDVIDARFVGHRGVPVGTVDSVFRDRRGTPWLRFATSRALERHDGLQIDVPGLPRPFGFAVENLRTAGGRAGFEAPAGATVEIALPDEYPAIPRGAAVCCSSSQDVKRRYRFSRPKPGLYRSRRILKLAADVSAEELVLRARAPARFPGDAEAESTARFSGPFAAAKDPGKTDAALRTAFQKLGDTRFALGRLEISNPQKLFLPVSPLNQLRREVTAELEQQLARNLAERIQAIQEKIAAPAPRAVRAAPRWSIKVERAGLLEAFQPEDWKDLEEALVEIERDPLPQLVQNLEALAEAAGHDRIRLALPLITRSWEEQELTAKIEALRMAGWKRWEAANVSAWAFLDPPVADLAADWSVYVTNSEAARQVLDLGASRVTLSPEDGLANLRPLLAEFGDRAIVIAYQDTPLFISASCVAAASWGKCPGPAQCSFTGLELTSSHGDQLIAVRRGCRTVVINRQPFCLAGRLRDLASAGAPHLRADFLFRPYTPAEVRDTWRALRSGKRARDGHVGNFDRGLL